MIVIHKINIVIALSKIIEQCNFCSDYQRNSDGGKTQSDNVLFCKLGHLMFIANLCPKKKKKSGPIITSLFGEFFFFF